MYKIAEMAVKKLLDNQIYGWWKFGDLATTRAGTSDALDCWAQL